MKPPPWEQPPASNLRIATMLGIGIWLLITAGVLAYYGY